MAERRPGEIAGRGVARSGRRRPPAWSRCPLQCLGPLRERAARGIRRRLGEPGREPTPFATHVHRRDGHARIIARNDSPDIGFDQSINPYRGCEHGCIYCYARPDPRLSRPLARARLRDQALRQDRRGRAAARRSWRSPATCRKPIALGANTDPYQPIERELPHHARDARGAGRLPPPGRASSPSRRWSCATSTSWRRWPRDDLVKVALSVTTLDRQLARSMEPRAATPRAAARGDRALAEAGIPAGVMVAPIIPALNDHEIERDPRGRAAGRRARGRLRAAAAAARDQGPLPRVAGDRLSRPRRARAAPACNRCTAARDYTAAFGLRQKGSGPYAQQIAIRFRLALKRLGLNRASPRVATDLFRRPGSQRRTAQPVRRAVT